jgi:hypothetical protein
VDTRLVGRQGSRSLSISLVGADRLSELRPVWASLHEHHTMLQARGRTRSLGSLRDLESSWQAQRGFCERALGSNNSFLVLAEAGPMPIGYALVSCRRHPIWSERSFGSVEVLCVRATDAGLASLGSQLSRGRVLLALLSASLQEARRRGLSQWSAVVMEANSSMRAAIERLGGEPALVTYRGFVSETASRLDDPKSFRRARAVGEPRPQGRREQRRNNVSDQIHGTGRPHAREHSAIGPEDLAHLRKILRFYPGAEEMLHVVRKVSPIGFPINSFADLEDGLGGGEVKIRIGGRETPLRTIRRFVPMHYFPVANENDLIAKFAELRRRAASAARQARGRRGRAP